ncbi:Uncharacterised protein [Mycobacteroides abscessus subsp. abscessus]|nr:Uncharacterised protein [Mycobacteroides abscessus subsp. abscessus]
MLASVAPMFLEWMRRRKAGETAEGSETPTGA